MIKKLTEMGIVIEPSALKLARGHEEKILGMLSQMKERPLVITREFVQGAISGPRLVKKFEAREVSIEDYISAFKQYYNVLQAILLKNPKLKQAVSIGSAKGNCAVVGLYKAGFLEDPSGRIKLIHSAKLLDGDVVGALGSIKQGSLVAQQIIFPDAALIQKREVMAEPQDDGLYEVGGAFVVRTSMNLAAVAKRLGTSAEQAAIELLKRRHLEPPIVLEPQPDMIIFSGYKFSAQYKNVRLVGR